MIHSFFLSFNIGDYNSSHDKQSEEKVEILSYGVKLVALTGTFCRFDDGMNQQRIFGHSLCHQQNAFWDA